MGSEARKYIRSDHNPTDVLTKKLKTQCEGPPFLKREWPKFEENPKGSGKELSEEMKPLNNSKAANTHKQVDCSAT